MLQHFCPSDMRSIPQVGHGRQGAVLARPTIPVPRQHYRMVFYSQKFLGRSLGLISPVFLTFFYIFAHKTVVLGGAASNST